MKRKFILYPAVALALMTSASLSSCVDTDEPESLEALRNAKAEEIRANAGLISAKADVEKAYVAVVNAKAAQDEAIARQQAAVAAMKEYEAALDKVQKDLEIAKTNAKSEAEVEEAKLKAENALSAERANVEKAKYELQDAIAKYKEKIDEIETTYRLAYEGFVYNHNDSTALRKATRDVIDRKRDLSDAQLALSDALTKDDKDFQDAVDNAQKAYDLSVSSRDAVDALLSSMDIAKITEEYNAIKKKKDNADWVAKEYDLEIAKLTNKKTDLESPMGDGTTDGYKKTTKDKETAYNNAKAQNSGKEAAYKNSMIDVSVKCKNKKLTEDDFLGKEIGAFKTYSIGADGKVSDKKDLEAIFVYDEKDSTYKAVQKDDHKKAAKIRQDDVEEATKALKAAFATYATKGTQNVYDYDLLDAKLHNKEYNLRVQIQGKDGKSELKKTYDAALKAFNQSKTDATKFETASVELKDAIEAIFGTTYDWKIFTTTDAYADAVRINDKNEAVCWKTKDGKDLDINDGKLGLYGEWKKATIDANDENLKSEILNTATAAVNAIEKLKKDYDATVKAKQNEDANVANVDAVKKAKEAWDAAKKVQDDQQKLIDAVADEIKAKKAEKTAAATDSIAAYDNILNALMGFSVEDDLFKDKDGNKIKLTVTNFAEKKAEAMKALNEDVAKKEKALAEKKQELEDYKAGRYDKVSDIRKKQDAVKEAERALEDAEAKLERVKANPTVAEASAPATEEPATEEPVTE